MKKLTLKEYCKKHKISVAEIAYRCGMSYHQVYRMYGQHGASTLKNAVMIEKFTEGEVPCELLLPSKMLEKIKEKINTARKEQKNEKNK